EQLSGLIYKGTRDILKLCLRNVIRSSVITHTDHPKRKTITAPLNVVYPLKRSGCMLYGFGA
ncbi:hypothetical protein GYMLUDRAFT_179306, partial [Collybiopsis luxurians FD-317 M1]